MTDPAEPVRPEKRKNYTMSGSRITAALDTIGAVVETEVINDTLDGVKIRALCVSIFMPDGRSAIGLSFRFKAWEATQNAYEMLLNCPMRKLEVAA